MTTPAVTPQIEGLPPGAILRPAAQASAQPAIEGLPPGAILKPAAGYQPPAPASQPSLWQVLTQPTEKTDKEYLGYTGPAGVAGATIKGLDDVARNFVGAAKGTIGMFDPRTQPGENALTKLPIVRALRPFVSAAQQVPQIPGAVKDINASADPTRSYLDAAQDTASQGAGQALLAIAGDALPEAAEGAGQMVKKTVPPFVRGVAKGTNVALAKAPAGIGAAAGGAAGYATHIPGAGPLGAILGATLGKEFLPKLRVPGEDFGLPKPIFPRVPLGPENAPTGEFVDSAPESAPADNVPFAPAQVVNPKFLPMTASGATRRMPGEIAPEDVNPPDPSVLGARQGIRIVLPGKPKLLPAAPEATPPETGAAPQTPPPAVPPAKIAPAQVNDLLNRALGNEPPPKPVSGQPIYQRPAPTAPTLPTPPGMTPLDSRGIKAYSYSPSTKIFTAQWPDGSLHQYGEVTPETVQAFESAPSKGRALLDIKDNHVHLAANYGKGWVSKAEPVRSAAPDTAPEQATAAPASTPAPSGEEDLLPKLQESVRQAEARKAAQPAAGEGEQGRPFVAPESSTTYGTRNRVVSADEAAQARANLQSKMFRSNAGFDPTMIADAAKLGAYHLEAGLREFGAWSQKMIDDLGEQVKPHLQAIWSKLQPDEADTPNAPAFYSKAAQVVNDKVGGSGSGDQILATLRNNGVKENEIGWMGLDDFLKGKPKVSKAELQQFIGDNQIQLEESTRGTNPNLDRIKELQSQRATVKAKNDQLYMLQLRFAPHDAVQGLFDAMKSGDDNSVQSAIQQLPEGNRPGAQRFVDTDRQLRSLDREAASLDSTPQMWNRQPKYENYTLPGDKSNYTEMLMKLPEQGNKAALRQEHEAAETERTHYLQTMRPVPGDVELRFHDAQNALRKADNNSTSFNSSHFDEPNILAHVRFDDRVAADGKPTLFLEEVQSDWHQQGKKLGYQQNPMQGKIVPTGRGLWRIEWPNGNYSGGYMTREAAEQAMPERAAMNAKSGVPDAPFKSDWHELAMKRMLRYAAENGYDRIAWTTGDQQAARYDLAKQIQELNVYTRPDGNYDLSARKMGDGSMVDLASNLPESKLPDYVGKDLAQRIVQGEGTPDPSLGRWRSFSGLDLKVGGDWAKALYDRAIPNFLNKYTKKWGAKVGETVLPNANNVDERFDLQELGSGWRLMDRETNRPVGPHFMSGGAAEKWLEDQGYLDQKVHSLDITPAMKKSVLKEGQPISKLEAPFDEEMATA